MKKNKQQGFTLLEVIIAMTIMAMGVGSILSLMVSNKRLAFSASQKIEHALFLRASLNIAQIVKKPKYPEEPEEYVKDLDFDAEKALEKPDKQTQEIPLVLEPYTYQDTSRDIALQTLRWQKKNL